MFFWKSWDKESRIVYLSGLFLLFLSFIYLGYFYFVQNNAVIEWQIANDIQKLKIAVDGFSKGVFDFNVENEVQIIFQQYFGSDIHINILSSYVYLVFLMLAFALALTTVSFLNNWLYFLATFAVLLFFIFQQPNVLLSDFTFSSLIQVSPVLFVGGTSYIFYAFAIRTKFLFRFIVFLAIISAYYLFLFYFSGNQNAVAYLINLGVGTTIILTIAFIFLISFEIVYHFLYLISGNKVAGDNNGTIHFAIIYFVYTANLVLQYLYNAKIINFEVLPISPFFIYGVSVILGIWGFRQRSVMFSKLLPFYPFGAVVYVAWAIVANMTIGYFFASANDPMIEVFEDIILFSHIGFGFGFFIYVAWNYTNWINGNLPVYKLIYSYQWISFLSVYGVGILIALCLFFYSNMFILRQGMAGYYNGVGDIYMHESNYNLAEEYYELASTYEFQNHKTNYSLATIYKNQYKVFDAIAFYKKANLKRPSAFAYANMAALKLGEQKQLEAILDLREGLSLFPNSTHLLNNLGVIYERINFPDSAIAYLNKAETADAYNPVVLANKAALLAKYKVKVPGGLKIEDKGGENLVLGINNLAYDRITGTQNATKPELKVNPEEDSILTETKFAYLNNYGLYFLNNIDTNVFRLINRYIKVDSNKIYRTDLEYLKAFLLYYNNDPAPAVRTIDNLQISDQGAAGGYLNTLGIWAMKNNLYQLASNIFELSNQKGNKIAKVNKAIALTEAGKLDEAFQIWNSDEIKKDKDFEAFTDLFNRIFTSGNNVNMLMVGSDFEKYAALHYKLRYLTDEQRGNLFFSIKDDKYKLKAGFDLFDLYYNLGMAERCGEIISEMQKSAGTEDKEKLYLLILKYEVLTKDWDGLKTDIEKLRLTTEDEKYKLYFQALLASQNNDTTTAGKLFDKSVKQLPFNEEVLVNASMFWYERMNDISKSFNILLDGVTLNPYSITLYKAYCIRAIHFGIPSFADNGLEHLKSLMSEKEYKDFILVFLKEKDAFSKKLYE